VLPFSLKNPPATFQRLFGLSRWYSSC